MTDIVFLDTETLGLHFAAPIWEFAAERIDDAGHSVTTQFFIDHIPGHWPDSLPESFQADYRTRFDPLKSLTEADAAKFIHGFTNGRAIIAGSNPAFDMQRLEMLLARYGYQPGWHYHPLDVPTMALGWLAARGELPPHPWKSDAISALIGVDPTAYDRHTAAGDVAWSHAMWGAITNV